MRLVSSCRGALPIVRAVLLAAALLVTLLALEALVRVFRPGEVDTETLRRRSRQGYIGNLVRPADDPDLVYELRPLLDAEWRGVLVATNSEGARVSTLPTARSAAALKIAVLGDSTAFGWGVFQESVDTEVLGEMLARALNVAVEVRNYSVPGYNTRQELACFRKKAAVWRPDLVILHYDHNDAELGEPDGLAFMPPEYGDNPLKSALVKLVRRRWRRAVNQRHRLFGNRRPDKSMELLGGFSYLYEGPAFDAHLDDLAALGREAGDLGIPVLAVIWECLLEASEDPHATPYYRRIVEPVVEHMRRVGFRVLPLFDHYHEIMRENRWPDLRPLWLGESDAHPTPRGHALMGDWIAQYLIREQDLLRNAVNRVRAGTPGRTEPVADSPAAAYRRGLLLADQGFSEEAVAAFRDALRSFPDDPAIRLNLGRSLRTAGRPLEALGEWQRVLTARPGSVLARLELGPTLANLGAIAEARRLLMEAAELSTDETSRQAAEYWLTRIPAGRNELDLPFKRPSAAAQPAPVVNGRGRSAAARPRGRPGNAGAG